MINGSPAIRPVDETPTIWGLKPEDLHDRYWAARGVCVVRPGEQATLPQDAQLFMLTDCRTLALFPLRRVIERVYWMRPAVLFVRLRSRASSTYREIVKDDGEGRFTRFERHYAPTSVSTARIALTRDRRVAEIWQTTDGSGGMWQEFRRQTRQIRRETMKVEGRYYDRTSEEDLDAVVQRLVASWHSPSSTIDEVHQLRSGVWGEAANTVGQDVRVVGRVWIGSGRKIPLGSTVAGPAVLWDDPQVRPVARRMLRWDEIEPAIPQISTRAASPQSSTSRRAAKRAFDVAFSLAVLLVTLPLYPLIMLAIWIEDGRPFFFGHRRETLGGREFPCFKFRSMRKDADRIKKQLEAKNQSDGPQFFIENDPRATRVGRFLRKTNLDELPQFINVLLGHMAVVGPRPSPRKENQFCPAWREARLSVRPGVTGLWQVSRTRRHGLDFQEWIQFDMEYVERASWWLDVTIIFRTIRVVLGA